MEEDGNGSNASVIDTTKAERSVWLMKCPLVVSKSWQAAAAAAASSSSSSSSAPDSHPVSKVVVSLDPLRPDDSLQVIQF